jgi:hypothetical protein
MASRLTAARQSGNFDASTRDIDEAMAWFRSPE